MPAMPTPLAELSVVQLRCFVAVVDAGSFAAAARRLGLSTSALSKAITRLEHTHGVRLLHRSTHALSLTQAGEQVIDAARETVQSIGALEASLAETLTHGGAGRVRISAPVGLVRRHLAPLLPSFMAEHPDIFLDLRAGNELVDLAKGGFDIAIRGGSVQGVPGHRQMLWFTYPWVACAAPGYLRKHGTPRSPDELESHVLLGFRNRHTGVVRPWRFRVKRSTRGAYAVRTPNVRIAIDDGESVWMAARHGAGIAMVPLWLAAPALRSGRVIEVLRPFRAEETPVSILRRERRLSTTRVDAVVDFLKAHPPQLSVNHK